MRVLAGAIYGLFLTLIVSSGGAAIADTDDLLYQILVAEDHRQHQAAVFTEALDSHSTELQVAALRAIGRIQDPAAVERISAFLSNANKSVRLEAATALGLIGTDAARVVLTNRLGTERSSFSRVGILLALGFAGDASTVQTLAQFVRNRNALPELNAAARAIGQLMTWKFREETLSDNTLLRLGQLAVRFPKYAPSFAFAMSRYRGEISDRVGWGALRILKGTSNYKAKALLLRVVAKFPKPRVRKEILRLAKVGASSGIRVEALRALAKGDPEPELFPVVLRAAFGRDTQVARQALTTLEQLGEKAKDTSTALVSLHTSGKTRWIRAKALTTLAAVDPSTAKTVLETGLTSEDLVLKLASLEALGLVAQERGDVTRLISFAESRDNQVAAVALSGLARQTEAQFSNEVKAVFRAALERQDEALTSIAADMIATHEWREFAPVLASNLNLQAEGKVGLLTALAKVGSAAELPAIKLELNSPTKQVVEAAAAAYLAISGEDVSDRIPLNSRVEEETPPWSEIQQALASTVRVKTSKGIIRLKMLDVAPLTVTKFLRLVKSGFYNGKGFHRVVPNFVAQGGDPRGDGYGGPGYLIRDEVSTTLLHGRGTVGIATAGKDTGGSQFFFNHAPNYHLDGHYTLFAKIITGLIVMDQLEEGDKMISVTVEQPE